MPRTRWFLGFAAVGLLAALLFVNRDASGPSRPQPGGATRARAQPPEAAGASRSVKAGASDEGLARELIAAVRDNIGAVASFKAVDVVPALPKTRSGKILRKTMRGIADGRDEPVPSTIEDPAVLETLKPILRS